ncbi:hypothetical protein ACWGI8_03500, partial [Streptomyces sp. NPDC054841]
LDGLGAVGGGAHADHEYLVIAAMAERANLVAGLVNAIRNGQTEEREHARPVSDHARSRSAITEMRVR